MSETTRTGSCHCGAVRFEVDADLGSVIECNCSHCARKGFLLAFTPAQNFRLLSGADALSEYRFNKNAINHQFCRVCGVQAFASGTMPDGSAVRSINVRCIDGFDPEKLNITQVDGKSY